MVLKEQDPKEAKELYVKGLQNDKLFRQAVICIRVMIKAHEESPTTLALKAIFNFDVFFDPLAVGEVQKQLKDPSNPIHDHLKKFVEEEGIERNIFLPV